MTKVFVDPVFGAKLNSLGGAVEVCDESGRTLAFFHPVATGIHPTSPSVESPFSEEEIERRWQERGGRPLKDILADLNRRWASTSRSLKRTGLSRSCGLDGSRPLIADFRGAKFDDSFRVRQPGFPGVFGISAVDLSSDFWRRTVLPAVSGERGGCSLRGQIGRVFWGFQPWLGVGGRVILATAEGTKWMTRCREVCYGRPDLPGVLSPADRHLASPLRGPPFGLRRASVVVGCRRSLCRQLGDRSQLDQPIPQAVRSRTNSPLFSQSYRGRPPGRGETADRETIEVADAGALSLKPGRRLRTPTAGVFLFWPLLARLRFDRVVNSAEYPGSKMIPATSALLSLLVLKLLDKERRSHIDDFNCDDALGLWAGLNVLPKKSFATDYS